jgi:hypothetical protein
MASHAIEAVQTTAAGLANLEKTSDLNAGAACGGRTAAPSATLTVYSSPALEDLVDAQCEPLRCGSSLLVLSRDELADQPDR